VAIKSIFIKNMIEDLGTDDTIPIRVNEAVLKKVVQWCDYHQGDPVSANDEDSDSREKTADIEKWDQEFMQVDQEMLFEIILVGFKHRLSILLIMVVLIL
jgi:S-phase kinase-associated protein 1